MCVIAYSPKGVDIPAREYRRNMFWNNDDGAGFAYIYNGLVHWQKGFMTFEAIENAIEKLSKTIDLKETDIVFHYRIGTHGANCPELTHPFKVCQDYKEMSKLQGDGRVPVIFHNGIINSVNVPDKVSDTMAWVKSRVGRLYAYDRKCLYNPVIQDMLIEDVCYGYNSKLAIVTPQKVITLGNFIEDAAGNKYSNSSYSYGCCTYSNCSNDNYSTAWYNDYELECIDFYSKVKTSVYQLNESNVTKKSDCIFIETEEDYIELNQAIRTYHGKLFVDYSLNLYLIKDGVYVPLKANLVDACCNKVKLSALTKDKYVDFSKSIFIGNDNRPMEAPEKNPIKFEAISLQRGDEIWNMDTKTISKIEENDIFFLTENDEIMVCCEGEAQLFGEEYTCGIMYDGVYRIGIFENLLKDENRYIVEVEDGVVSLGG